MDTNLLSKFFCFGDHAVDLLLTKTSFLVCDGNALGLAAARTKVNRSIISEVKGNSRSLIGGTDFHDTVSVNLEGDLNLRNTTRGRRDTGELEFAQVIVVLGQGAFTFEHLDQYSGLVIGSSRETIEIKSAHLSRRMYGMHLHLALFGRNDRITRDQFGKDTTSGLNTERERVDIDKDNITQALVAGEDTTLNGSTVGDGLIGVDTLGRLLPKVLLEELLDLGDTSGTTNKDDLQYMLVGFATTDLQEN